jgi:hypothetical protein
MKQILAVFRGQALLADAPEQASDSIGEEGVSTTSTVAPSTTDETATASTLPSVAPEQRQFGVVPVDDPDCR